MKHSFRTTTTAALVSLILAVPTLATAQSSTTGASTDTRTAASDSAGKAKDSVAKAGDAKPGEDSKLVKTVNEAFVAMRDVRAARLALMHGNGEQAGQFVEEAEKNLQEAQGMAKDFAMQTHKGASGRTMAEGRTPSSAGAGSKADTTTASNDATGKSADASTSADTSKAAGGKRGADDYIPFDMTLVLAEGYVPSQEKDAKLEEANRSLSQGDHETAAQTLKLANIDVTVAAALIPARSSLEHVRDAAKLIGEKKLYEANVALKAVEDSVILEFFGVDAVPKQGTQAASGSTQPAKPETDTSKTKG